MELKTFFLEQLEKEVAANRKVLERVPEGQNGFKPHPRSMELGYLAALVATMPGWPAFMITQDEVDLDGADVGLRTAAVETRAELLALLEKGYQESKKALTETTDEELQGNWRLYMQGRTLTEGKKYDMIANGALSHLAHHRGQLTVYLRLNEAMVPAIYGPSADEHF